MFQRFFSESFDNFRSNKAFAQTFTLATVRSEEFTFQSPNAEDIRDLVMYFLEGLKKRSKFVIALQDYKAPGEGSSNFLDFAKGDLILLDEDTSGEAVLTSRWCTGTCERNEERGDFPAEADGERIRQVTLCQTRGEYAHINKYTNK